MKTATATQLVRDLQSVREMLASGPVQITSHGRTEFFAISKERYENLLAMVDTDSDRLDAKLRLVLDTIPSMIVITDRKFSVRRANRAWCNFTGLIESELVGKNLFETIDSPNSRYIHMRAKNVLQSGREESFELTSGYRPGRLISFTIRPWPQGVALFSYDRTEEATSAERQMRDIAYDTALEKAGSVGFGSLDPSGRISFPTHALGALLGADPKSLKNVMLETVLDPASKSKLREILSANIGKDEKVPVRFLRDGGSFQAGVLSLVPYSSVNGQQSFAFVLKATSGFPD